MLLPILQPYSGFRDLGIVPGRGIAFVDFDTVRNAEVCLSAIKSAVLPSGERIYASYAKYPSLLNKQCIRNNLSVVFAYCLLLHTEGASSDNAGLTSSRGTKKGIATTTSVQKE